MTERDDDPVALVRAALVAAGVGDTVRTFPAGVPTASAAAEALGCDLAAITNSLIFDLGGEPLLILASGAARVDTRLVAEKLGAGRIRRASPDFVLQHTGQAVGGVAPVGHPEKSGRSSTRAFRSTSASGQAQATTTPCSASPTKSCTGSPLRKRCLSVKPSLPSHYRAGNSSNMTTRGQAARPCAASDCTI